MRPVDRSASPSDLAFGRASRPELARANHPEPVTPSRALVPVAAPRREDDRPQGRPASYFVAHLIATHDQAPQTRERRRADPGAVIAAYAARLNADPSRGRVLARVA
jgi:hypothetical protein